MGRSARAAIRAAGIALFLVIGLTVLIIPATLGLYVDNTNDRMGPETAPTLISIAIGVAAVATALTQIDTKRSRTAGARQAPPLAPTLVQVLLIGPLAGAGIAGAALLWRTLSTPLGAGPGLWNDYLHSPLAVAVLALAVWSTANVGLACGSILGGTDRLGISCAGAVGLLLALAAAAVVFLWLLRAEPGTVLLALAAACVALTMVLAAGAALLRSSGALLRR